MKKILALTVCVILICTASVSLAADLTLPVKLQRQMQHDGNGLKGSIRITANADPAGHPFLYAIQNAEYSLLRNASGEQWHLALFQSDEQEQQINRIELYQADDGLYFRSDLLDGKVIRIPATDELLSSTVLSGAGSGENPPILNILTSVFSMREAEQKKWAPVIDKYAKKLEVWLSDYAASPETVRNADGSVQMNLIYLAPADAVREEIVALITEAAADPEVTALLGSLLTEEQKAVYMNAGYASYYTDALKALNLEGDLRFVKTVTALGEMIASEITMPLDPALTGYKTLTVSTRGGQTGYTLSGDTGIVRLTMPAETPDLMAQESFDGTIRLVKYSADAEAKEGNLALKITFRKEYSAYNDDETAKGHEVHRFTISVERDTGSLPEGVDEADIPEFDPIGIEAELHFSGKTGPNAPTTLEANVTYERGALSLAVESRFKTASTWPFVPFGVDGAVSLGEMNEGDLTAAALEWMANATERIAHLSAEGGTEE